MGHRYNKRRESGLRAAAAERQRKAEREAKYKNTSASETVNINDVEPPFRVAKDGTFVYARRVGDKWVW